MSVLDVSVAGGLGIHGVAVYVLSREDVVARHTNDMVCVDWWQEFRSNCILLLMVDQFSVVPPVPLVVVIILVLHLLLFPIQVLDVSRVLQVRTGHGGLSIIMSVVVAT